ncbi:MAG: hypothetical protein M1828_001673 [Chrysothrix sp. TS-e1954]|nr:MAG: hypothetical protein M1828_001673 [Chrysothrix sp. TS-e1954]
MVRAVVEEDTGLKVLREPRDDTTEPIDIIAIHGIGAHPDDTWTKSVDTGNGQQRYVNWLKDDEMLPNVVPSARIMRYGYESQWFGKGAMHVRVMDIANEFLKETRRYRKDCSDRPLMFIAHCFGGLVVVQSLVEAEHDREEWPGLYQSTTALVFFGTPFRGAEGLSQEEMIAAALREYSKDQIQGDALRILQPGNEMLQQMLDRFGKIRSKGPKTQVACFYELKSSEVGAIVGKQERTSYVVNHGSGCLDLSESTEKHSLSRTHMDMHRFGRADEVAFITVKEVVERMSSKAYEISRARSEYNEGYRLPLSLADIPVVSQFVGRESELQQMEDFFHPVESSVKALSRPQPSYHRKVLVLHGLGGIGKTQLCVQYVFEQQDRYSAVIWLDGSSKDSLKRSMIELAANLPQQGKTGLDTGSESNADKATQTVLAWLSIAQNRRWLLIFDNVDRDYLAKEKDPQAYDVSKYFPWSRHGSILITSRLDSLRRCGKSLKLGKVSDEQARRILENELGYPTSDNTDVQATIEKLDGLPLALTLAGSLVREMGWTFSTYNEQYEQQWLGLATEQDEYPLQEYEARGLLTTWLMSYNQVKNQSTDAVHLLRLWSMLSNKELPYKLIAAGRESDKDSGESRWLLRIGGSKLAFSRLMRLLLRYSLADSNEAEEKYSMHSVLHEWVFYSSRNEDEAETNTMCWTAAAVIARQVPFEEARDDYWSVRRKLVPHASHVCRRAEQLLKSHQGEQDASERHSNAFSLGHLIASVGRLEEAEKMYMRALQGYEKALGQEHTSTLDTVNHLGLLFTDQGKLKEAEKMYLRALQGYEKALGREHTSTLHTVNNLGNLYSDQGKLEEAEKMYMRALQGYEKALGQEHTSTLDTVNNLGNLFTDQGKLKEAEKMYLRALQGYEKALGREHTSTLNTVNNLGTLYKKQGKLDKAEKMYMRALQGTEKALGREHTSTLDTVNNLGLLFTDQGKLKKAEKMYMRALQGTEKALGREHTSTLDTVNNLGLLFGYEGKLEEAEKMYMRALQGYEAMLGAEHWKTCLVERNLRQLSERARTGE